MGKKSESPTISILKEIKEIVAVTGGTNSPASYFTSNVEHVKTLELEAILHLVCGYATSKQINLFAKDKFMKKFDLHDEIENLQDEDVFKLLLSIEGKDVKGEDASLSIRASGSIDAYL